MWGNDSPNGMHTAHNWLARSHRSSRWLKEAILADQDSCSKREVRGTQRKIKKRFRNLADCIEHEHESGRAAQIDEKKWPLNGISNRHTVCLTEFELVAWVVEAVASLERERGSSNFKRKKRKQLEKRLKIILPKNQPTVPAGPVEHVPWNRSRLQERQSVTNRRVAWSSLEIVPVQTQKPNSISSNRIWISDSEMQIFMIFLADSSSREREERIRLKKVY